MNEIEKADVGFAQIKNEVLFAKDISLKAKGLFAYIYAKPRDWQFSSARIADEIKEGRKSILGAMKELEDAGYLTRKRLSDGRVKYYLSHTLDPQSQKGTGDSEPQSRNGTVQKRHRAERATINKTEINKDLEIQTNTLKSTASVDEEDMDLEGFIAYIERDKDKYRDRLAAWAETTKPQLTTKGQWKAFIKRNVRTARQLDVFTNKQIGDAYEKIMRDSKDGQKFSPTLETIFKYLTR